MSKPSAHRVLLAKEVARQWLQKKGQVEYRLRIFGGNVRNLPGLLRSFRDDRVRIAGVDPLPSMGIQEGFDSVTVWSSNHSALKSLQQWAESIGMETTGVW